MDVLVIPQSAWVPIGTNVTTVADNITGRNAAECKLNRLCIETGDGTVLIDDIRIGTISFNGTNLSAPPAAFDPEQRLSDAIYIGLPLKDQQDIVVQFSGKTLAANPLSCMVFIDPLDEIESPPGDVKEYPECCPLYYGLGTFALLAATNNQRFEVRVQKPGVLGQLYLDLAGLSAANMRDVHLTSIELNGLPLQNGQAFARGASIIQFAANDDTYGKSLDQVVNTNDIISFTFDNLNAGALTVRGCIYAKPGWPGLSK